MIKETSKPARPKRPKCRQSISFTQEQHDALMNLAEKNHVSICWVVRFACDRLIENHRDHQLLLDLDLPADSRKSEASVE